MFQKVINNTLIFSILAGFEPEMVVPVKPAPVQPAPAQPPPVELAPVQPVPSQPKISSPGIPSQSGEEIITHSQDVSGKQPTVSDTTNDRETLRQASLYVAVSGVTAMSVLAYIQRRGRVYLKRRVPNK